MAFDEKEQKALDLILNAKDEEWGGDDPRSKAAYWIEKFGALAKEFEEAANSTPGAKKVNALLNREPNELKDRVSTFGTFISMLFDELMKTPEGQRSAIMAMLVMSIRMKDVAKEQQALQDLDTRKPKNLFQQFEEGDFGGKVH